MDISDDSMDEQDGQDGQVTQEPAFSTHLLIRQRNELYRAIQHRGLLPSEFEWRSVESTLLSWELEDNRDPQLLHIPTGYFVTFTWGHDTQSAVPEKDRGAHSIVYSPDIEVPRRSLSGINWRRVSTEFDRWLAALKAEVAEGDLWAQLADQKKLISPLIHQPDNTPFTPQEQARIQDALEQLKLEVRELSLLTEAQYDAFAEQIDYQKRAAGWLGRIDWSNALVGALMSCILGAALNPGAAQEVMRLTLSALSWMVHHPPLIP